MAILLGLKADRVRLCQEVAVAVPAHLVSLGYGDGGDVVGLYGARSQGQWNCLHRCSLGSNQTADVKFSRDGAHLIVWDDPVQCSIQIL